jgi:serine/threonine protein kinase
VYLASDEQGKEYAIKITDLSPYKKNERSHRLEDYERELDLLQKIDSPYVAKYYGRAADTDSSCYYLLLEYCNSDLQKLIKQRKILPEKQAEAIILHIF